MLRAEQKRERWGGVSVLPEAPPAPLAGEQFVAQSRKMGKYIDFGFFVYTSLNQHSIEV